MTTTASPAKSDSKKPLHSLVAELDRQYRNTRKDWKKSSANFSSHEDRFRTAVPVSPLPYNPNNGTISDSIAHSKKSKSSWAKNSSPQRPPVPEIVCKGDYNPTESPSRSLTARSAFVSQSPKFVETPAQAPPPGAYDPATPSPSKQRPSATMQSKSPRFSDPVIWTQTAYNPDVGTLNHEVQKSKKVASPWAKDKAAQRPSPTKLVDAVYEPKTPGQVPVVRSAFKSAAPRFLEEKAQAPPVGTYTSPLISCGMLS